MQLSTNFAANGNIITKSNVSSDPYLYNGAPPHAVTGITNPINMPASFTQTISYTPYQRVSSIVQGTDELIFTYGTDGHRVKTVTKQNNITTEEIYFVGSYEKIVTSTNKEINYIYSPNGLLGIMIKQGTTETFYYTYTDYLGNIIALVDQNGNITEEYNFDAWGQRRNAQNWSYTNVSNPTLLQRGFTGHEHLDRFGLINMNARLYDPLLGRMLSPDNYVQSPDNIQSFNRYSYAWNNPLKYTDPDGQWVHLVVGAVIGGTLNWMMNGAEFSWKGLGYFGVGAAAGALGAGIGAGVNVAIAGGSFGAGFLGTATVSSTGFIAGFATGAAGGVTNGLIQGTGNGLLGGQNFGSAVESGLNQAWKQGLAGGVAGGVFGGLDAVSNERTFWTGNAKQYKGTEALYASLEGGSDVYLNTDDYTVFNQSGKDVYYKPEDGVYGVSNKIKTGHGIKIDVDGIATSKYTNQVFKIPGKYGFSPNALVKNGGDVQLNFSTLDKAALNYQLWRNSNYHYGWSTLNQLDGNWKVLFDLARLIR